MLHTSRFMCLDQSIAFQNIWSGPNFNTCLLLIHCCTPAAATEAFSVQFVTGPDGQPTAALLRGVGAQATFDNTAGQVVVVTNNSPGTVNIPISSTGDPTIPAGIDLTVISTNPSIPSTPSPSSPGGGGQGTATQGTTAAGSPASSATTSSGGPAAAGATAVNNPGGGGDITAANSPEGGATAVNSPGGVATAANNPGGGITASTSPEGGATAGNSPSQGGLSVDSTSAAASSSGA